MKAISFPKTTIGKWAVRFGAVFAGLLLFSLVIAFAISGESGVIEENPFIIILNLALNLSGLLSFILGIFVVIKYKEWLVWKYLAILYSLSILLFLTAEFLFPH